MTRTIVSYISLFVLICSPAVCAENQNKPWTALFLYSDGHFIAKEDLKYEKTCREAVCQIRDHMSCDEKIEADRKAKDAAERAAADRETKIAEYRLTHSCKIIEDEKWETVKDADTNKGEANSKKIKVPQLHCPTPDGGERVYDKEGKAIITSSGDYLTMFTGSSSSSVYLTKAVCYQ